MRYKVGVLTSPLSKAGVPAVSNIIEILRQFSDNIVLITGNEGYDFFKRLPQLKIFGITYEYKQGFLQKLVHHFMIQLKTTYFVLRVSKSVNIWIIVFSETLVLPLIVMKLLRKPVIYIPTSSTVKTALASKNPFQFVLMFASSSLYNLSNLIGVFSKNLITDWSLSSLKSKISIINMHFLDFKAFRCIQDYSNRANTIGYIGRFSDEKGVINFIEALPMIKKSMPDLKYIITGDGNLYNKIEFSIDQNGLNKDVSLQGWVPHEQLPILLNSIRLLVVPSYTEGLPMMVLESMACNTPVLVTPVGALPDIIIDGKTGFIMENNSPESIAENTIRALNSPDLEGIAEAGRQFVEENFTFESTVARWREVLKEI